MCFFLIFCSKATQQRRFQYSKTTIIISSPECGNDSINESFKTEYATSAIHNSGGHDKNDGFLPVDFLVRAKSSVEFVTVTPPGWLQNKG